jgi:hypothetical protein
VVLSFWPRDDNRKDSYRASIADIPVSSIACGEEDPWQCQQCEPFHCHEGWCGSLTISVVALSRVLAEDDYTRPTLRTEQRHVLVTNLIIHHDNARAQTADAFTDVPKIGVNWSMIIKSLARNAVFWDVTPCGSSKNRRFRGTYHLHHHGYMNRRARNNSLFRFLVTANVVPSSPILVTLMCEVIIFPEPSVLAGATRRTIQEDGILHSHRRENHKSYRFEGLSKRVYSFD